MAGGSLPSRQRFREVPVAGALPPHIRYTITFLLPNGVSTAGNTYLSATVPSEAGPGRLDAASKIIASLHSDARLAGGEYGQTSAGRLMDNVAITLVLDAAFVGVLANCVSHQWEDLPRPFP